MTDNQTKPGAMVLVQRERIEYALKQAENGLTGPESPVRDACSTLRSILAEQPPAVGGEPRTFSAKEIDFDNGFVECVLAADHRAHVAPLLAEISYLRECVAMKAQEHLESSRVVTHVSKERNELKARIAELEAGQGEPVAWQLDVEGYQTVTVDNYQRALSEQEHFHGRGRSASVHGLYRQAQPATAKIERHTMHSVMTAMHSVKTLPILTSNQYAALAAKLNGTAKVDERLEFDKWVMENSMQGVSMFDVWQARAKLNGGA